MPLLRELPRRAEPLVDLSAADVAEAAGAVEDLGKLRLGAA
jgi:hypothetical protein